MTQHHDNASRPSQVLVLGGTGKTGRALTARLTAAGVKARVASRSASSDANVVRFDWNDVATHGPAVSGVDAIYLIAPLLVADPSEQMLELVRRALDAGVRRFILLSSSAIEEGMPGLGTVHAGLRSMAPEWAVLRPSWFMENFVDPTHHHGRSIAENGEIVSAAGSGRIGFVSVNDIAAVAFHALTDRNAHNAAHIITGPQALSYDDVAGVITQLTGNAVRHVAVSTTAAAAHMAKYGVPELFAGFLASLEHEAIRNGSEDRVTDTVLNVTGVAPRSLGDMLRAHRAVPGTVAG
ncbi:NAD(P)H-binding protein [Cupriavidus sp. UYPR2.512]|uniref:NmrA family NAD(P)-binding protein n=1 Tax=Cupriavidus sp. UYPR2.512 TaxID=1080187 RepID=UPI0006878042|nr:NAD(P)H-binding protein [Cupriavidus sp. UYPR2.512]UIF84725.1 NAD(P)H-binding protein [Cupriavidus necator]